MGLQPVTIEKTARCSCSKKLLRTENVKVAPPCKCDRHHYLLLPGDDIRGANPGVWAGERGVCAGVRGGRVNGSGEAGGRRVDGGVQQLQMLEQRVAGLHKESLLGL